MTRHGECWPRGASTMNAVEFVAGEIEGEHRLAACPVRVTIDDVHHRARAFFERTTGTIRLKFVVLDKINVCFTERVDQFRRLLGRESDRGFDDGANQRPSGRAS